MTDRVDFITVGLEHNTSADSLEDLVKAIKMLKGVLTVKLNEGDNTSYLNLERAKILVRKKLFELVSSQEI